MIYISSMDEIPHHCLAAIPVLLRCCTGSTKNFKIISARCHREFYHGTVQYTGTFPQFRIIY